MNKMTKAELIEKITPLYNQYKKEGNNISGVESLIIMWDIGDLLGLYIKEHNVPPHNLYRDIYGKSEGSSNTSQKSYITREFQGRCYRIRNIFSDHEQIEKELSNLKSFTTFREAMPFFDNEKYKLIGEDKISLLSLLNSSLTPKNIMKKIKILQKNKIGIKNPRTQRLDDLKQEKDIFVNFYNYLFKLLKSGDYKSIKESLLNIPNDLILNLSKNLTALTQEGLKTYDIKMELVNNEDWKSFIILIKNFILENNPKKIRRFRRLIPVERFARLAEMLFALSSENNYKNFH